MLMMLPFEAPTIFEGIHKSYFRMPRVVRDQRGKFENDDLFRQLSHESAVKYTGFKDRPLEERQMKFITNCQEGHTEISVVQSGNQFTLMFNPTINPAYGNEGCDFEKELGKVHIKAGFILNGVCVRWRGWLDIHRLEGFGCLEFDEYQAIKEDANSRQQIVDKQQTCNSSAAAAAAAAAVNHLHQSYPGILPPPPPPPTMPNTHQTISPLARLNHQQLGAPHLAHPNSHNVLGQLMPGQAPPPIMQSISPAPSQVRLSPTCSSSIQHSPIVSLADASAAHYGNAAIAAAAAAAFHQALSVGAGPPPHPPGPLHGLQHIKQFPC